MRCLGYLLVAVIAVSLLCPIGARAAAAPDIEIFKGDDPSGDGISLGAWGSGGAVKTKEQPLEGAWSIKMSTQGLYSGARVEFKQPVTLFADGIDPTRYLQFAFFFSDTQIVNPAAGTGVTDYSMLDVDPYEKPKAGKMRFVFVSDKGETVEAFEPTGAIDPDDKWMRIAVPLAKFKQKEGITEFRMKQFQVFTDIPSSIYLGSMKLTSDSTPIKVDPLDPKVTSVLYPEYFVANATGGISSLRYTWDLDSANGIQADCTERVARCVYKAGGKYTITLTVSDADGLKTPVTVSTTVEVTD